MNNNEVVKTIHKDIENVAGHELPNWIGKCVFDYFAWDQCWRMIDNEPVYLIGLCEDEWDYYWIWINNKESKLHFVTCCYNMCEKCNFVTKKWTKDEKQRVTKVVNEYFDTNKDEKLLFYAWDNINNE